MVFVRVLGTPRGHCPFRALGHSCLQCRKKPSPWLSSCHPKGPHKQHLLPQNGSTARRSVEQSHPRTINGELQTQPGKKPPSGHRFWNKLVLIPWTSHCVLPRASNHASRNQTGLWAKSKRKPHSAFPAPASAAGGFPTELFSVAHANHWPLLPAPSEHQKSTGSDPEELSARGHVGGADSGIGQQSRSQAVWNQTEKLMDCFEHGLSELLHIQGGKKRTKTKINQVYALWCSGRLGFYQLQNPGSSTVQHLFISYKVALNKLSVWLASQLYLPSPVSQIHQVFIDDL